ncbi:MAG: septum site-determining protein MinC [Clostridiales bacterium]|nr:septum site-determining protein MinC [Clostridiales bacterium]
MNDEIIKLKGTGDGVKIFMSPKVEFSEIVKALYGKLDEFRRFFGSGKCNIYFIGREVGTGDKIRLESIAKTMLPASTVHYGEKPLFLRHKEEEKPDPEKEHEQKLEEARELVEERVRLRKEAVATNFKRSRARYFEGDVSGGNTIESDGHLILMGDVLEDGCVSASGNVIILGRLLGRAHAGNLGSREAYILALDFLPREIQIADMRTYPQPPENGSFMAKIDGEEIFIEKFGINL